MQIRMNTWMKEYFERPEMNEYLKKTALSPEVAAIIESRIVEVDGCFLLEALTSDGFDIEYALSHSDDRTDLEWQINGFQIPIHVTPTSELDPLGVLAEGHRAVTRLADRLEALGHFKVAVGFQNDKYIVSHIHFYKDRWGEYKYVEDIESCKGQPILIIDT
jgi:hypothetical protein